MHFGDSIFIFLMALVLFGPKKLPEIGRTIGKLLAEFRRASNEFKFQIQEELRNMEDEERRKKLAEQQAQKAAEALPASTAESSASPAETPTATPTILPPSTGTPVSTSAPYATPIEPEPAPVSPAVTPSAAEVLVEPPAPSENAASAVVFDHAADAPAHIDLTAHNNGTQSAANGVETVESVVPSESVHHG
jgi:sec-independent protein translocase protein TatB